MQNKGLGNI